MSVLPRIAVTGASGFLGRRLVGALLPRARVVGIDRLPRAEGYIPEHPNLEWFEIDLADEAGTAEVFAEIRAGGPVDAVVHLAAFYDFTGERHPEYQRTNVEALRVVLEACRPLNLRRFVFASSVAACKATRTAVPITEDTPPAGDHPYAVSKRRGEEMLRERTATLPWAAVRLGALFSDWCEYPALHSFLEAWFSNGWNARILAGRGETSIPFLHVRDAVSFFLRLLERMDRLERGEVLIASSDGSVSHRELFDAATAYYYGEPARPRFVPQWLAGPGLAAQDAIGRLTGERPFARPWMARYIDTHLHVDAEHTRRRLGWEPQPRLGVLKRIPYMVENRRADPIEWLRRNREAIEHHYRRANYVVYRLFRRNEPAITAAFERAFAPSASDHRALAYLGLPPDERAYQARLLLRTLMDAVRTGAKGPFMTHCRELSRHRADQGFTSEETLYALGALQRACLEILRDDPGAAAEERSIHDIVTTTIDFGIDQVLEVYDEHAAPRLDAGRR